MNSILNVMKKVQREKLDPKLNEWAKLNGYTLGEKTSADDKVFTLETAQEYIEQAEDYMSAQFTGRDLKGEEFDALAVDMQEAMQTTDASIIFPRVINTVLREPKEPNLFLTANVADTVTLPDSAPIQVSFPRVSALEAHEMGENQDYRQEHLSFTEDMTSIQIKKYGLGGAVSAEVVRHSMWPILTLYLRMMSNAIDRKIESVLYTALTQKAQIVFDNNSTDTTYRTTGKGENQAWNGSYSYDDLVKQMSVLLGNHYNASHFITHPLAWSIFAQDPILRAQFYHGGAMGQGMWTRSPQFDQQAALPFNIQYVPYYAIPYAEQGVLTGGGAALGASLVSDIYVIDKANSLWMATRGGTEMDQMDNWYRDAKQLKARKFAGVAVKDGGKGMTVAKNVRVVQNYQPIFTTRTVAS